MQFYAFLEKPIDSNRFRITINNTLKNLELNSLVDQINTQNNEAVGGELTCAIQW